MNNAEQIAQLDMQIAELSQLRRRLADADRKLASQEFIRVNRITKDDVEPPEGDGKPWFGHISEFIQWMKEKSCHKRFASWNGQIYFTSDLFAGKMPATPALMEDVP